MKQQIDIKPIIAVFVNILAGVYFISITLLEKTANESTTIAVVSAWSLVNGYYFGASTGSAKKDETIQELAKKQNETN